MWTVIKVVLYVNEKYGYFKRNTVMTVRPENMRIPDDRDSHCVTLKLILLNDEYFIFLPC